MSIYLSVASEGWDNIIVIRDIRMNRAIRTIRVFRVIIIKRQIRGLRR